nr:ABC transporter substrate-binding protein [uncultured Acetobacter sp.]
MRRCTKKGYGSRWLAALCLVTLLHANGHAENHPVSIGMYPSYPPLDMRNTQTNTLEGFDVDLSHALLERAGRSFEIIETSFAQLIPSLLTDRIQMFFNGMMDTPVRRKSIGFVDYLQSGLQFITLSDDSFAPHTLPELCGRMIATSRITSEPASLIAWSNQHCVAEHKPPVELFAAENSADARLQLREGRVAAVLQDSLTAPWTLTINPGQFRLLGDSFELTPLGIGLPKNDTHLQCLITAALAALQADGTYLALIRKWHLPESSAIAFSGPQPDCSTHEL